MTAASPVTAAVSPGSPAMVAPAGSSSPTESSSSYLAAEFVAKGPIFSMATTSQMIFLGYHNGIIGGFPIRSVVRETSNPHDTTPPLVDTSLVEDAPPVEMAAHSGVVRQLVVHEATKKLYSCSSDGSVKSWTVPECAWVMSFEAAGGTPVHCFVLDAQGGKLYSGDEAGGVTLWNAETGEAIQTMRCHYGTVNALQIPTMPLPTPPTEGREEEIPEEEQEPPRPNCVLTGSSDGQVKLIEPATKLVHVLMKADAPVVCIHYAHPNVLAGCSDGTIRAFNVHSASPTMIFRGHKDGVNTVVVVKRRVISISDDTTVGIWNPRTWNREMTLRGHDRCVSCAVVVSSDKMLLTGGFDGVVRGWDLGAAIEHLVATGETVVAAPKKKKKPEGKAGKKKK